MPQERTSYGIKGFKQLQLYYVSSILGMPLGPEGHLLVTSMSAAASMLQPYEALAPWPIEAAYVSCC
jgi:hypothetical protein